MKQDNKKLYESIMSSVAKEVKKSLNEYGPTGGLDDTGITKYDYKETMSYRNVKDTILKQTFNVLDDIVNQCIEENDGTGLYAALGYAYDHMKFVKMNDKFYRPSPKTKLFLSEGFKAIFKAEKNKAIFKKLFKVNPDINPKEAQVIKTRISNLYKAIISDFIGIFG